MRMSRFLIIVKLFKAVNLVNESVTNQINLTDIPFTSLEAIQNMAESTAPEYFLEVLPHISNTVISNFSLHYLNPLVYIIDGLHFIGADMTIAILLMTGIARKA